MIFNLLKNRCPKKFLKKEEKVTCVHFSIQVFQSGCGCFPGTCIYHRFASRSVKLSASANADDSIKNKQQQKTANGDTAKIKCFGAFLQNTKNFGASVSPDRDIITCSVKSADAASVFCTAGPECGDANHYRFVIFKKKICTDVLKKYGFTVKNTMVIFSAPSGMGQL